MDRRLLALVFLLALLTQAVGCDSAEKQAAQPPTVAPTQASSEQTATQPPSPMLTPEPSTAPTVAPTQASQPTSTTAPETDQQTSSSEMSGDAGEDGAQTYLKSYQNVTLVRDGGADGPVMARFTAEWDAENAASRTVIGNAEQGAVEEITIGASRWTRLGSRPWIEQTLTPEEEAAWFSKLSLAQLWGDASLIEEDLGSVLPEGVELVPAQIFPLAIKAAMVFDGEETVNGVHCRRYAVDTDLDYSHDLPGVGKTDYTGHATGVIWVADQSSIPPVIIRAQMDQDLTTTRPGYEQTTHPYWEHDLTHINEPVTIAPPE